VSPWLNEELRIFLAPDGVAFLRGPGSFTWHGIQGGAANRQTVPFQARGAAASWRPALAALEAALDGAAKAGTAATVILSNRLVRYMLVSWQAALAGDEENLACTRHCFCEVYGKDMLHWEVRLTHEAPGRPRLAVAVDGDLVEALRSAFGRSGILLHSIQPHLMAAFNESRQQLRQRSAWFALLEPGHLCLALLYDSQWSAVRSWRIAGSWREELLRALAREAFLADPSELPTDLYLGQLQSTHPIPKLEGWQVHALQPALPGKL